MYSQSHSFSNSPHPFPVPPDRWGVENFTALSYRSTDLRAYLTEIILGVSRLIQSDWTIITILGEEKGQIIVSSPDIAQENANFSVHGTLANEVVRSGQVLVIQDVRQNGWYRKLPNNYLGYLGVPLKTTGQEIIGTICSFLREPRAFTESEIKNVELFAARAAISIENYQLYQQQLQFNQRLTEQVASCSTDLRLSQEKLIERERLAAIGEFTTMIVHEVRNPLTTIELGLGYAQKVLRSDGDRQRLDLALSESHRLKRLLNEILSYAKPRALRFSRLNIGEFLEELLIQIRDLPEAVDRDIAYCKRIPETEVMADIDMLKQVFLNLFRNAFEAIAPQETVSCSISYGSQSNWVCVRIHNGGTPIPPELLPQLTTPFCSTKPSGTGLGLAISKRIIKSHGGELEIDSSDSGTTVSVHLPPIPISNP